MKYDMNRALVEVGVTRTLRGLQRAPARTLRNLVDLGQRLTHGRFSLRFFQVVQNMLEDQQSPYYALLEDVVAHVRLETLQTFGMNLGYNGLTRGAALIRKIEAEQAFNIPWALTLQLQPGPGTLDEAEISALMEAGKQLGIYTYMVFLPAGMLGTLRSLCLTHPDCALVAFVHAAGEEEAGWDYEQLSTLRNVMFALPIRERAFPVVTAELRRRQCLYAGYLQYGPEDVPGLLEGKWIQPALSQHCTFMALVPRPGCPAQARQAVARFAQKTRDGQEHPILLYAYDADHMLIDEIISGTPCFAGVDAKGGVYIEAGTAPESQNIRQHSLGDILRGLLPRPATA